MGAATAEVACNRSALAAVVATIARLLAQQQLTVSAPTQRGTLTSPAVKAVLDTIDWFFGHGDATRLRGDAWTADIFELDHKLARDFSVLVDPLVICRALQHTFCSLM